MIPDLRVSISGIELKNPVIAASGTFGYGIEFEDVVHLNRLGGFVVKGLSKESMPGNPPPRLCRRKASQAAGDERRRGLRERLRIHARRLRADAADIE